MKSEAARELEVIRLRAENRALKEAMILADDALSRELSHSERQAARRTIQSALAETDLVEVEIYSDVN